MALTDGEDPGDYQCTRHNTPVGEVYLLDHKPNGDCVYLGETGCTIHGRHPLMCRAFDCVAFARHWPRARRRAVGLKINDVFREGQERLRQFQEQR